MREVEPTQQLHERVWGIEFPRRANRAKGISIKKARDYAQRWRTRTGDVEVYLYGVKVPHAQMFIDAGLGKPVFFRTVDGNEWGRFPDAPTSPISLKDHPVFANQGEDYDGQMDAITSENSTTVQGVITGARRVRIRRAGKLNDLALLPPDDEIRHPRNAKLAREIRRRLEKETA